MKILGVLIMVVGGFYFIDLIFSLILEWVIENRNEERMYNFLISNGISEEDSVKVTEYFGDLY